MPINVEKKVGQINYCWDAVWHNTVREKEKEEKEEEDEEERGNMAQKKLY